MFDTGSITLGHLNAGLYMRVSVQCGLMKNNNNNNDNLCKGIYEYRTRCFYCLIKMIKTQEVSLCIFYTKRHKMYIKKSIKMYEKFT